LTKNSFRLIREEETSEKTLNEEKEKGKKQNERWE